MKMKPILSLLCLALLATGCKTNPVPANTISIVTPRGKYNIGTPKNNNIEGFDASVDTNGTVSVKFDKWTSTNDPQVVDKAYAGQALVLKTSFDGLNQTLSKLVEGGVKGAKGGL